MSKCDMCDILVPESKKFIETWLLIYQMKTSIIYSRFEFNISTRIWIKVNFYQFCWDKYSVNFTAINLIFKQVTFSHFSIEFFDNPCTHRQVSRKYLHKFWDISNKYFLIKKLSKVDTMCNTVTFSMQYQLKTLWQLLQLNYNIYCLNHMFQCKNGQMTE